MPALRRPASRALPRAAVALVGGLAVACSSAPEPAPVVEPVTAASPASDAPELVLRSGATVTARNGFASVTIRATSALEREYRWMGYSSQVRLMPRRERWNGSFGAYDPGASFFGTEPKVVADEGRQFFDSVDEALRFLYSGCLVSLPVWTPDGLVVGIGRPPNSPDAKRVSVEVYQIYVGGAKPVDLPGARPDLVQVSGPESWPFAAPNAVPEGFPRVRGKLRLVLDAPYSPLEGLLPAPPAQ